MTWLDMEKLGKRYRDGWNREQRRLARTALGYGLLGVLVAAVFVTVIVRCLP